MKSLLSVVAIIAAFSGHAMAAEDPQQPTLSPAADMNLRATKNLGCYKNPGDMWDMGPYTFQSTGWCQPLCVRQGVKYFGVVNGTNCFCGNSAPDPKAKVNGDSCDMTCLGIDTQTCGGENMWQIYDDGFRSGDDTGSIDITTPTQTWFGHKATNSPSTKSSSKESTQTQAAVSLVTVAGGAVQTQTQDSSPSSGPNKAGIAAGVVVGVIALAGIIGGVIFFMRRKKQKEFDDERRRHEAMTTFVRGEKTPSTYSGSDSRLEPSVMFQRRQSDGSIADNQDYSRRILKVTNPDDR